MLFCDLGAPCQALLVKTILTHAFSYRVFVEAPCAFVSSRISEVFALLRCYTAQYPRKAKTSVISHRKPEITNRNSVVISFYFPWKEGQIAKEKHSETLRSILNNDLINVIVCGRCWVFTALGFYFIFFHVVMTCNLLCKYQIFREIFCLHLQGKSSGSSS